MFVDKINPEKSPQQRAEELDLFLASRPQDQSENKSIYSELCMLLANMGASSAYGINKSAWLDRLEKEGRGL